MKDPRIRLAEMRGGPIYIVLQWDDFAHIFYNVTQDYFMDGLKNDIESVGYKSDFAEWDSDGRFIRLTRSLDIVPGCVKVPGVKGLCFELDNLVLTIVSDKPAITKHRFYLYSLCNGKICGTRDFLKQYGYPTNFAEWTESGQWAGLKQ